MSAVLTLGAAAEDHEDAALIEMVRKLLRTCASDEDPSVRTTAKEAIEALDAEAQNRDARQKP
jgi:hypothetical protein